MQQPNFQNGSSGSPNQFLEARNYVCSLESRSSRVSRASGSGSRITYFTLYTAVAGWLASGIYQLRLKGICEIVNVYVSLCTDIMTDICIIVSRDMLSRFFNWLPNPVKWWWWQLCGCSASFDHSSPRRYEGVQPHASC